MTDQKCQTCQKPATVVSHDMKQGKDAGDWKAIAEHHYCPQHLQPGLWVFNDGHKMRGGLTVKE